MCPDAGWDAVVADHYAAHEHGRDVCCTICQGVDESLRLDIAPSGENTQLERYRKSGGMYWSARVGLRTADSSGRPYAFSVHWAGGELREALLDGQAQECGCVLGGCYALRRSWYLDGLHAPWKAMRGWGSAEQTMSMVNWLRGGRNVILPVVVGHWFRLRTPYSNPNDRIAYNQQRLIGMLPMPAEVRAELVAHLAGWPMYANGVKNNVVLLAKAHEPDWPALLAESGRTVRQYFESWGKPDMIDQRIMEKLP
jgi:hypothetical protein